MRHSKGRPLKALACFLLLVALAGTVTGAGYVAADNAGITVPHSSHDCGLPKAEGGGLPLMEPGISSSALHCYFPIWNLPAYYLCVMGCKLEGHGDICPTYCELKYRICD